LEKKFKSAYDLFFIGIQEKTKAERQLDGSSLKKETFKLNGN